MTLLLQISLTTQAADPRFGKNPAVTPTADGYQIHQPVQEPLRAVQKAGRSLDNLGVQQVQLTGAGWTLDKQWAFYQGFCSAKKLGGVSWTGTDQDVEQLVRLQQCFAFAKKLINQTPEELSPQTLCAAATAFIETVAPRGSVTARTIVGDELLAEAGLAYMPWVVVVTGRRRCWCWIIIQPVMLMPWLQLRWSVKVSLLTAAVIS